MQVVRTSRHLQHRDPLKGAFGDGRNEFSWDNEGQQCGDTVEEVAVLAVLMLSAKRVSPVSFHVGAVSGTNLASFRRF